MNFFKTWINSSTSEDEELKMSEKKAKITLSGLSKGGSSNAFMSFRFSPESEEIQEIIQDQPDQVNEDIRLSESLPASPKQGGDTSPLKEYLKKERHKWTNKWDKKSLSLDLDLKGKIKTAIEDRTKSILSNFIPEETPTGSSGVIHQSQSIPENFTTRVFSSVEEEENSQRSCQSGGGCGTGGDPGSMGGGSDNSSGNGSQETLDGDDIFKAALDNDVEEIGVDVTNFYASGDCSENMADNEEKLFDFHFLAEELQETFDGYPTLYQPLNLTEGIRVTPLELIEDPESPTSSTESIQSDSRSQLEYGESEGSIVSTEEPTKSYREEQFEGAHISTILINMIKDIMFHHFMKWEICLIAINILMPSALMWFLLGCSTAYIIHSALTKGMTEVHEQKEEAKRRIAGGFAMPLQNHELRVPTKSQGWMTEMEGDYDVATCHFRLTRVVFVRLDNHNLYLFYPHAKNKVPKRRLWNDPIVSTSHLFEKQKVFDIAGATIKLIPEGLARKRFWNKKYPISIKLPKHSMYHEAVPNEEEAFKAKDPMNVNYNATAGVSMNSSTAKHTKVQTKEFTRIDSGSKTIFLFARCDREKDDWFRRLTWATKIGPDNVDRPSPHNPLTEYRHYMNRIVPGLGVLHHPVDGFDNVSLNGEVVAHNVNNGKKGTPSKGTPNSSRKTTPEKEKPHDLQNILTIPDSPKFLNALVGRLFLDFLKSPYWIGELQKIIDKKLSYMKKPGFIKEIHVKSLDLGNSFPVIQRASKPVLDFQGLWIDLDITYDGKLSVALLTHVNFLNMKAENQPDQPGPSTKRPGGTASPTSPTNTQPTRASRVYDSEADDSGESSEEEASEIDNVIIPPENYSDPNIPSKSQKFIKFTEKIVNSKFMNRTVVKNIVNTVASKPVVLGVELKSLIGTLTINIPPPPNDRIWLGFRTNPIMDLVALPLKFGDTNINLSQVTGWLQKKILLEFQKTVICPNMVDVSINLMDGNIPK